MKRFMLSWLLVVLLATSVVWGADNPNVLVLRDDGYYLLQPGTMSLVHLTQIVDQRGTPGPNPGPTPPPAPGGLQETVSTWAKQVDHPAGRAVLAEAYKLIGQQIQAGAIPSDAISVDTALAQFLDQSLDLVQGREKWGAFRVKVADELSKRIIASGGTFTKDQWASFFGDVSAGLKMANADYAMPDWLLQIIQALLPILLQLLTRLFGG